MHFGVVSLEFLVSVIYQVFLSKENYFSNRSFCSLDGTQTRTDSSSSSGPRNNGNADSTLHRDPKLNPANKCALVSHPGCLLLGGEHYPSSRDIVSIFYVLLPREGRRGEFEF